MELNYQRTGKGPALIILHGLYGSGTNWLNIARELSSSFTVYLIDQRNHGSSPHDESHSYEDMANDLKVFCNQHQIDSLYLIGHSMGGKTAITFTLQHPGMTKKLICVDISPFSYLDLDFFKSQIEFHKTIINTFKSAPLNKFESRNDADVFFAGAIQNKSVRKFLLKNLKRNSNGQFYWQLNINALERSLEEVLVDAAPPVKLGIQSFIPTLFIRGGKSPYITDEDLESIPDVFPNARFVTFNEAGHWLHAEESDKFVKTSLEFLKN